MPRLDAWASASARLSSGSRASGRRARDARQTVAEERRVDEQPVFAHDIGEMTVVAVEPLHIGFEPHPAVQHQLDELLAGLVGKRRRRVVAVRELGRVDAEQPHAPDADDVDRVAVENGSNEHGIRVSRPRR